MISADRKSHEPIDRKLFVDELLAWHRDNARDFPWRRTTAAYPILVAEFMLQQTAAIGVVAIFEEFIRQYPMLDAAASADDAAFGELLQPLGLTHRSLALKRALEAVVERHQGVVPKEIKELMGLPGVGPYIARAVACHAYGCDFATVDVNVVRVIGRVLGLHARTTRAHRDKSLWQQIDALVPPGFGRPFNLALLDLAAEVCRKKNPLCEACPIRDICCLGQVRNK